MIAGGDPPAIYAPFSSRGYRYYAARGLSQELDDLVARDGIDLADFQLVDPSVNKVPYFYHDVHE